jgi:hypothetical protein
MTPHGFDTILQMLNETSIKMTALSLSSFNDKVSGYPGFFSAADYIASKFTEYGLKPYHSSDFFEYYNLTIPFGESSYIKILEVNRTIKAYAFWPNLVNPSPYKSDTRGDDLVLITGDTVEAFEGKNVRDKIVVMDFNSLWLYKYALAYGAKGAIFVPFDESRIMRPEAEQKLLLMPIYFPRLYVPLNEGGREIVEAAKRGAKVFVSSNMVWKNIEVPNVVGYLKGRDPVLSQEAVVISAHYDSWSIVPSRSPGATDSLGISVLLETARVLSIKPPKRSVIFLAYSGRWQFLSGVREFIDRHFEDLKNEAVGFIGIDLSGDSETVAVYNRGSTYHYTYASIIDSRYSWLTNKLFMEYLSELRTVLGADFGETFIDGIQFTTPSYIRSFPPYEPDLVNLLGGMTSPYGIYVRSFNFMLDSDPYVLANYGSGFTFRTSNSFRRYLFTEQDTYDKIDFNKVFKQVKFIIPSLWGLLNEKDFKLYRRPLRLSDDWGFATLRVQVSLYNPFTGYYDAINASNLPEVWKDAIVVYTSSSPVGMHVYITKPDKSGIATIKGLRPYEGVTTGGTQGFVDVYVVDGDGRVTWATDLGVFQAPYGRLVPLTSSNYTKIISAFPCASVAVLSVFSPTDFRNIPTLLIYNSRAHGPMIRQSSITLGTDFMAFVQPEVPTELLLTFGERFPVFSFVNASENFPSGAGYKLKQGEQLVLNFFDAALNQYWLTRGRYMNLKDKNSYTPTLETYYELASRAIASRAGDIPSLLSAGYLLAIYSSNFYASTMDLLWQVVLTLVFFLFISIAATFTIEKLVFGYIGLKRAITLSSFIGASQILLYLLHPGYTIATNAPVVMLSSSVLVIVLILIMILGGEAISTARELRERLIGAHFAGISRSALIAQSFDMGVENMKKRKVRTSLMLLSLAIMALGLVSFASITLSPVMMKIERTATPSYDGIHIRRPIWSVIPPETAFHLQQVKNAKVAPRAWIYAPPSPPGASMTTTGQPLIGFGTKHVASATSILALAPEEREISDVESMCISGRWFTEADLFSVIIPSEMVIDLSKELGNEVGVGSEINLWGLPLKVVGIVDSELFTNITEPNGEIITPVDMTATQFATPPHYHASRILIIPFKLYERLVFPQFVMSIVLKSENSSETPQFALNLARGMAVPVSYSQNGASFTISARQWLEVAGGGTIIIPAIISAFSILSLMLGSIYERNKEIRIYNAVGMAPIHISLTFLIEALTYAMPTALVGYLGGILITNLLTFMGVYPQGLYPNFSSVTIVLVLLLIITVILTSSLYPSLLVAKLAVPSMERRWRVPKPFGDSWTIPLPFVVSDIRELEGVLRFLAEFFKGYTMERGTMFSVSEEKITVSEVCDETGVVMSKRLNTEVRLAPYELGIVQSSVVEGIYDRSTGIYSLRLIVNRKDGLRERWITSNTLFIDMVRKQLLVWRGLPPSEREKYFLVKGARGE